MLVISNRLRELSQLLPELYSTQSKSQKNQSNIDSHRQTPLTIGHIQLRTQPYTNWPATSTQIVKGKGKMVCKEKYCEGKKEGTHKLLVLFRHSPFL